MSKCARCGKPTASLIPTGVPLYFNNNEPEFATVLRYGIYVHDPVPPFVYMWLCRRCSLRTEQEKVSVRLPLYSTPAVLSTSAHADWALSEAAAG